MFKFNHLDFKQTELEEKLLEDRHRYDPVYQEIEQYISAHSDIILGGSLSVKILLSKSRNLDDFEYICYSENALVHANNITNNLAKLVDALFVKIHKTESPANQPVWIISLKTIIPYQLYGITVNSRLLVKFYYIEKNVIPLIQPLQGELNKQQIALLPPRYHLIESYRSLIDPNQSDAWQTLLREERRLFKILRNKFDPSLVDQPKTGGSDIRQQALLQIMKKYIKNNKEIALIGEFALQFLEIAGQNSSIITCISPNPQTVVQDITAMFSNHISHSTREVKVFSDFRLTRTAIKIGPVDNQKEIMYVYNAAGYDLIPINRIFRESKNTTDFIPIGNPFVILRFLLIDIWIIRKALNAGKIDEKFADNRLQELLLKTIALRTKMSKTKLTIDDAVINHSNSLQIFQSRNDEYIGTRITDVIAQKTKSIQSNKFFREYFPQEHYRLRNEYRIINEKN